MGETEWYCRTTDLSSSWERVLARRRAVAARMYGEDEVRTVGTECEPGDLVELLVQVRATSETDDLAYLYRVTMERRAGWWAPAHEPVLVL